MFETNTKLELLESVITMIEMTRIEIITYRVLKSLFMETVCLEKQFGIFCNVTSEIHASCLLSRILGAKMTFENRHIETIMCKCS